MRIFLLFLCCGLAALLTGQADSVTTFQVGLSGGQYYNAVNFTFQPRRTATNFRPLGRPNAGVGIRYFNTRSGGFLAEINYTGGGWREELIERVANDTLIDDYVRKVDFIDVQVLTQIAIGRKRIRPYLEVGPYLSFPIGNSEELPTQVTVPEGYYFNVDLQPRFNYGIVGGLGVYLELGPIGLQVGGRYLAGVRDILKPGENGISISRRQSVGWRVTAWYAL